MPEENVRKRARKAARGGKAGTTQAGEFVREEIHHVREGKHGARSPRQAIAIGLSKARRAGVDLPPPKPGATSEKTRRNAERAYEKGRTKGRRRRAAPARGKRSRAALKREPRSTTSRRALARQARASAARRRPAQRSAAATRAARTKGPAERKRAARKAARTRAARAEAKP